MNKHSLLGMISACTVALILSNSAQAASFTIDDFNVDNTSRAETTGGSVSEPSVIDGANIVMNGAVDWTRTLIANISAGDSMTTSVWSVCDGIGCGEGHVSMAAGSANGIGTFEYNGPAIDLSSYSLLGFDWGADQPGASVDIIFSDSSNITSTVASWSPLAADPFDPLTPQTRMGITWGGLESSEITKIQFVVTGVGNLDSSIDNFTALVPVPAAAWLFGSALLGLTGAKRRKAQASR